MKRRKNNELEEALKPIIDVAPKYLIRVDEPDLNFVPENLREGALAAHFQLTNCLKALFELQTVHDDLIVCSVVAAAYPWRKKEITRHEHLSLAWSQFVNLCYLFEEKFKLMGKHYNAALRLFAVKGGAIAVGDGVREISSVLGPHIQRRGRHVHQWYDAHPAVKDFRLFETLQVANNWPDGWPEFESFYEIARDELCREIAVAIDETNRIILKLLKDKGPQLAAIIVRYNGLIDRFKPTE